MDKVKLPREVAEAIDYYEREHGDFWKHHLLSDAVESERYIGKKKFSSTIKSYTEQGGLEDILQALVNGYEVEQTPEEKVKEFYRSNLDEATARARGVCLGIKETLDLLNINIPGVNANE